jgi:hypothetical protein
MGLPDRSDAYSTSNGRHQSTSTNIEWIFVSDAHNLLDRWRSFIFHFLFHWQIERRERQNDEGRIDTKEMLWISIARVW